MDEYLTNRNSRLERSGYRPAADGLLNHTRITDRNALMRAGGAETTKALGAAPGKAIKEVEALKARTNHTRFQRVSVCLCSPGAALQALLHQV
jgi:hypothetical protein